MSALPEKPEIRPIEVKQRKARGEPAFELHDPLRLSAQVVVLPPLGLAVVSFLDGTRTIPQIARDFEKRHGFDIPTEQVETLVRALDEVCLLQGGRAKAAIDKWRKDPVRKPACAGGAYPAEARALEEFLDALYTRPGGPGAKPDRKASKAAPVRGLLSPHIDFHRGGHAYAHAWKALAESCEADLFVVFGTAHGGTDSARFALTRKSYETPLGTIETDVELVDRIVKAYKGPDDLFAGEYAHTGEHSIEFQMVELAHLYGARSAAPRKIRALPVLCGSIQDLLDPPKKASKDKAVRTFHDALSKALADTKPERICFVGGVDLMHVGAEFNDLSPLTEDVLETYMEQDRATLAIVTKDLDADAFHADLAFDESRKICGHSPIHATLEALERQDRKHAGELLCHDRWYDGESSVSFCSVAFRDGAKKRRA